MAKSLFNHVVLENQQITLAGDLLFSSIKQARTQLEGQLLQQFKRPEETVTISLKGVDRVDSSALSLCLCAIRLAALHNKRVHFIDRPSELNAIADLVGISSTLT